MENKSPRKKGKRPAAKKPAAEPGTALVPVFANPGPLNAPGNGIPQIVAIENLLPTADFSPQDLETFRRNRANVMDAMQAKMILEVQKDPDLLRSIMMRKGFTDFDLFDKIGRLERGQATQNINVAYYDAEYATQKKKIADLEALRDKLKQEEEDAKKARGETEEGSDPEAGLE